MQHLRKHLTTTLSIDTYPRDVARGYKSAANTRGRYSRRRMGEGVAMVNGQNFEN